MNQSIKHLLYFERIAEYQSLSAAAEELKVSQPALTASLRKMEQDLGFDLFQREGGRLILNPAGKVILPCVRDLLNSHSIVIEKAVEIRDETPSTIPAFFNNSPWAIKLKLRAVGSADLVLNGENYLDQLRDLNAQNTSIGVINYYHPFPEFEDLKYRCVLSLDDYTIIHSNKSDLQQLIGAENTRLVMPANSLVADIESRTPAIAKLFNVEHLECIHIDCFDTMISSCSMSNHIAIVPGHKKFWNNIYGKYLSYGDTIKSTESDHKMHVAIAYKGAIDDCIVNNLAETLIVESN